MSNDAVMWFCIAMRVITALALQVIIALALQGDDKPQAEPDIRPPVPVEAPR